MKKTSLANVLNNLGIKQIITIIISLVLASVSIAYIGNMLFKSVNAELKLRGEMDVIESSDKLSQYLLFDKNELTVAGYSVNSMLIKKASNEAILAYLTTQSERMKNALDKSFTGLYGYINGEYLDGAGWVPEKGYVPTERPWYKTAKAHPNETVFVDPYVDSQTGKVMITIAELLDDEKSVIALDIGLNGVQKIVDESAKDTPGAKVMVLDSSNVAIAHSDDAEVGKDYSSKKNGLGNMVVHEIGSKKEESFKIDYKGQSYMVFFKQIESDWHCASVIDTKYFYKPLRNVILITVVFGIFALILMLMIFYRLSLREIRNKDLHVQISAAADIYVYFFDIDLKEDSYYSLNNRRDPDNNDSEYKSDAQIMLLHNADLVVEDSSKLYIKEFIDLATISDRLKDKDTITAEYRDKDHKWCRARFICAERLDDGTVTRVLLGVEAIDDERREKEYLRHMAETDLLTGISNRVTGEFKTEELLSDGRGGMFVLFDIDHFKMFNDRFGHNVGDQVIISVANCLKNSFRGEDVVMRLGGDEFAAFAIGVKGRHDGAVILERFYDNLSNVVISGADGEKIFVSAGAAFCSEDGKMSFKEIYESADKCMYESKKVYNNQVTYQE